MHTFPLLATLRLSLSAKALAAAFGCHLGRSLTSGHLDTGHRTDLAAGIFAALDFRFGDDKIWRSGHWTHLAAVRPQHWTSASAMSMPCFVLRDSPSALTRLWLSLCESVLAKPWLSLHDDPFAHVRPSAPPPPWITGLHLDLDATPPLGRGRRRRSTVASSHCATHTEETLTLFFFSGRILVCVSEVSALSLLCQGVPD
jgi:hypothetical protein